MTSSPAWLLINSRSVRFQRECVKHVFPVLLNVLKMYARKQKEFLLNKGFKKPADRKKAVIFSFVQATSLQMLSKYT